MATELKGFAKLQFIAEQKRLKKVASNEAMLAPHLAINHDSLAPSDANILESLATAHARNHEVLATSPSELATVASLAATAGPSTPSMLGTHIASNQQITPAKKVFTPASKAQLNVRIDKLLKAKLDLIVATEGCTMNDLVERALSRLLATPAASLLAGSDSEDDLNDDVIRLFIRLTGKKVSSDDLEAYKSVRHLDKVIIKTGMLITVLQFKGQKINSFRYMLPEIEKAVNTVPNIAAPNDYVAYLTAKVRKQLGKRI